MREPGPRAHATAAGRRAASGGAVCRLEVTSSEAPNGRGDGNTAVDTEVIDATHVRVRSERSGQARTRIYTITLTCSDAAGNRATVTATVSVLK